MNNKTCQRVVIAAVAIMVFMSCSTIFIDPYPREEFKAGLWGITTHERYLAGINKTPVTVDVYDDLVIVKTEGNWGAFIKGPGYVIPVSNYDVVVNRINNHD